MKVKYSYTQELFYFSRSYNYNGKK